MKQWKELYGLQATFICPYCLEEFPLSKATKDHKNPYSRFKDNSEENIVLCCKYCNNEKGSLTPEEYARWKQTLDIEEWKHLEFLRTGRFKQREQL